MFSLERIFELRFLFFERKENRMLACDRCGCEKVVCPNCGETYCPNCFQCECPACCYNLMAGRIIIRTKEETEHE